MEPELVKDILSIVLPVLVAAGTGGAALWRQLQAEEKARQEQQSEIDKALHDYKLKADEAAWNRARQTIDELSARITAQGIRVRELEGKLDEVLAENHDLKTENGELRKLLDNRPQNGY